MKDFLKFVAIVIITMGVFYLLGCLIEGSFNSATWDKTNRIIIAIISFISGIYMACSVIEDEIKRNKKSKVKP